VRSIGVRRTQRLTWPGRRRAAWCVRSCTRSWSAFAATGRLAINVPQVSANTGESSRKRLSFVRYAPLAGRRFADAIPGSGVSCGSSPAGCSEVSDSPSAAFRQAPTQVVRGFEGPRTRNRRCRPRVSRSTGRPPQDGVGEPEVQMHLPHRTYVTCMEREWHPAECAGECAAISRLSAMISYYAVIRCPWRSIVGIPRTYHRHAAGRALQRRSLAPQASSPALGSAPALWRMRGTWLQAPRGREGGAAEPRSSSRHAP
jgi:hypothetical protein